MNINKGCHQDYLYKKEAKGKWHVYWVVLNGKYLLFYESKDSQKLSGSIQIGSNTKCSVSKRKTHSFPFVVRAERGCHLFKCETSVRRHQWMTSIQAASQQLGSTPPDTLTPADQPPNDLSLGLVVEDRLSCSDESLNDDLPSDVLLVAPLLSESDSPSLLRVPNRKNPFKVKAGEDKQINGLRKRSITVYPFKSENLPQTISDSEREQISSLNLTSRVSHKDFSSNWATKCSVSPRYRSLPSTPEKDSPPRSMSPLTRSLFGKTKSLNTLTSSDSLSPFLPSNMRFSRHMVSGNDVVDMEV